MWHFNLAEQVVNLINDSPRVEGNNITVDLRTDHPVKCGIRLATMSFPLRDCECTSFTSYFIMCFSPNSSVFSHSTHPWKVHQHLSVSQMWLQITPNRISCVWLLYLALQRVWKLPLGGRSGCLVRSKEYSQTTLDFLTYCVKKLRIQSNWLWTFSLTVLRS